MPVHGPDLSELLAAFEARLNEHGLADMATIGPVGIAEVRAVLEQRLMTLEKEQPDRRYGRVFVSGIDQVRGRAFRIVFVPGVPQKVLDDRFCRMKRDAHSRATCRLGTNDWSPSTSCFTSPWVRRPVRLLSTA